MTTQKYDRDEKRRNLADSLLSLNDDRYEVWKYFDDRADRLGEQLLSTGIWLVSIVSAVLATPFAGGFIKITGTKPHVVAESPEVVILVAVFGLAFCAYAYVSVRDIRDHIESNWYKSSYVLRGEGEAHWGGRKRHGWNILIGVGGIACLGFFLLIVAVLLSLGTA